MLPVDCPMLDTAELDAHLGRYPADGADRSRPPRHGHQRAVLFPPDVVPPGLRPGQLRAARDQRARAAGISFALEQLDSLGLDLDTAEDMADAARPRCCSIPQPAPRTAKVLWQLGDRAQQRGRLDVRRRFEPRRWTTRASCGSGRSPGLPELREGDDLGG